VTSLVSSLSGLSASQRSPRPRLLYYTVCLDGRSMVCTSNKYVRHRVATPRQRGTLSPSDTGTAGSTAAVLASSHAMRDETRERRRAPAHGGPPPPGILFPLVGTTRAARPSGQSATGPPCCSALNRARGDGGPRDPVHAVNSCCPHAGAGAGSGGVMGRPWRVGGAACS
jgi:hypothetical protein